MAADESGGRLDMGGGSDMGGRLDTPAGARAAGGKTVLHPGGQVWHDPAPRTRGPGRAAL